MGSLSGYPLYLGPERVFVSMKTCLEDFIKDLINRILLIWPSFDGLRKNKKRFYQLVGGDFWETLLLITAVLFINSSLIHDKLAPPPLPPPHREPANKQTNNENFNVKCFPKLIET